MGAERSGVLVVHSANAPRMRITCHLGNVKWSRIGIKAEQVSFGQQSHGRQHDRSSEPVHTSGAVIDAQAHGERCKRLFQTSSAMLQPVVSVDVPATKPLAPPCAPHVHLALLLPRSTPLQMLSRSICRHFIDLSKCSAQIKRAYRNLATKAHPDKVGSAPASCTFRSSTCKL